MRRVSTIIVLALCALWFALISSAQKTSTTAATTGASVPNLIRYGGTLKDGQDAPLAWSTVGVTFSIYSQQEGGAPIWQETQNVTPDATGQYSVLLGATTASGLLSQQEQRWLGVQVQRQEAAGIRFGATAEVTGSAAGTKSSPGITGQLKTETTASRGDLAHCSFAYSALACW